MGLFSSIFSFVAKAVAAINPVTAILAVAVGFAVSRSIKKKKAKAAQSAKSISGVLVSKTGTNEAIPVVYGERRIGGVRVFLDNSGTDNIYLHIVEVLCEGPIQGVRKVFFNDELVGTALASDTTVDYSAGSTDYSGVAATKIFKGDQTARISSSESLLGQNPSSNWPSAAVGNNLAYVYTILKWDQDLFGSGVPNITYTVEGKKIPGTLGNAHDTGLIYKTNPVFCIYDYLINPLYGKGIEVSSIDAAALSGTFYDSANYTAQSVQKTTNSADGNEVRYIMNAVVDTSQPMIDNLEDLLNNCRGGLITNEKYKFILDKPVDTSSAITIDDNAIVGNITMQLANKKTLTNRIKGTFPNAEGSLNFQDDIAILQNATLKTADGVDLTQEIVINSLSSKTQMLRIMNEELNQTRQSTVLECTVDPSKIDVGVFDVVKFTNTTFGQTNKLYRVLTTILNEDNTVTLNMREYDANVYWDNNKTFITNNKDDTDY